MSKRTLNVNVNYLTRVEGHGNIVIDVKNGILETCQLQIVEAPRLFEGMLRGRSIFEAQHITSRICGICACGHSLASIQAAEAAIKFTPSEQTVQLREFLLDMENLDSHLLHIYLLVAPDILGVPSFVPLIKSHNDVVRRALRMKKEVNDICDLFVGRHVHPISAIVGGFTKLPDQATLTTMLQKLTTLRSDMDETVKLAQTFTFPDFARDTEYVALVRDDDTYPMLSGDIGSTDGKRLTKNDYRQVTNEFVVSHSSAKHTKWNRDAYAVGALARVNLNYTKLHPKAQAVAEAVNFQPKVTNPYLNTVAQLIECVHCLEHGIELLRTLQQTGINHSEAVIVGMNEKNTIPVQAGSGIGAVEVPRGLLFHHYTVNDQGIITEANCIIPTGQNLANIEKDMQELVPQILDKSDEAITLDLEMLVRAYDPCISCSAHFLDVKFINR